jgi:hypothetical protein
MMSDICKVSDGTRVVGKCLTNFLYIALRHVGHGNGESYPKPCTFFVRKKYTTFCTEQIVVLWSVNKLFPESYYFGANYTVYLQFGLVILQNQQLANLQFTNKMSKMQI